ncbi:hypothetical protein Dtox_2699 [Desulfofarcimen acetoxidans DSM 771]|uniref:Uncharacterized protein n=1 Tax=Desulfofarcimen acetoxidans (strain ATCC 49208 / DSM 771 / KCTC 5769 / VKM B-1644 / 5575) TaxID=485916 RepID=C8W182_DESAS|nr:type 4a pilus biogenesis protein PilO [Desulfofarcimen acetoxidans]ACV63478.1 hypothetical protein Dtox_2699 [Desulfofarcimen acetoxidans DSM 771]
MLYNLINVCQNKLIELSGRERLLVGFFIVLIIVVFILNVLFPQIEEYRLIKKQLLVNENKVIVMNKQLNSMNATEQAVKKNKQKMEEYNKYFLQEINDGTVLQTTGNLAMTSGLELLSFHPQEIVNKQLYSEMPVTLVVAGDLAGIISFVDLLEHQQFLTEIKKINIAVLTSDNPKARAKAEISMLIYLN